MTVRARLKYFDGNNNEVVIGSLDDDGGEGIQDLTLKNSAREYTKVIVSGGNGLFGKFPTDSADSPDVTPQENADGPEMFLEVFNQSTGVFEVRDRVFAESQGTVSDNGNFKHKRLYGFEKFVGRQNVDLTGTNSVTTDIEGVLNAALPSGYVADVPAGATVPSVNNYRFKGRRDQVFKDLRENYNFIINFTAETDGSGNYLVKLEPRGFGGIVDTFEKGADPVFFDKWTKGDELRRITRAEVVGTDSNGVKVSGTASTNPDNGRFIRRNIGYLESDSEAQNIAVNLIAADSDGGSPENTEHGRVTAPIDRPATSNLNASIQILNDEINVNDSFTVVQQKDFFHQSQTQYSFEFEKELESRERRDKKDLGNRNSELITEGQQDVGNQNVDGNTEDVDDQYDNHQASQGDHDVSGQTFTETTDDTESNEGRATFSNVSDGFIASLEVNTDFVSGETDVAFIQATVSVEENTASTPGYDLTIVNNDNGNVYFDENDFIEGDAIAINGVITASTLVVVDDNLEGDQVDFEVANNTGSDKNIEISGSVAQLSDFSINQPSQPDGAEPRSDGSTNTTNSSDSSAGDTTSLDTDGSTDTKNVNVAEEDKVNR